MEDKCPLQMVLEKVGGKWKLLIIFNLKQNKVLRFGELGKKIPGISEKVLTGQLRELESDGFVNREVYPQVPPKVEYALTKRGLSLYPVLESLSFWAEKNLMKS